MEYRKSRKNLPKEIDGEDIGFFSWIWFLLQPVTCGIHFVTVISSELHKPIQSRESADQRKQSP